jgi:hypothetical protein
MRFLYLMAAASLVLSACKKDVPASKIADQAGAITAPANPGSGRIVDYHGLKVRLGDQLVMNDPVPVNGIYPGANQTMIATNGQPGQMQPAQPVPPGQQVGLALAAGEIESDYVVSCRGAGVPIAPAWGDPAWKLAGDLDQKKLFAGSGKTQLWTYSPPAGGGVCAALPRFASDDSIRLFGVLCVNLRTGSTCFWDNADAAGNRIAVQPGYTLTTALGADKLLENCSKCHRGDNPFIVVPSQPTAALSELWANARPTGPYRPLGAPQWQNPPATEKIPTCGDGTCHNLPALSENFCGLGLNMIRDGVMPDGGGTEGVKDFTEACQKLFAAQTPSEPIVNSVLPGNSGVVGPLDTDSGFVPVTGDAIVPAAGVDGASGGGNDGSFGP